MTEPVDESPESFFTEAEQAIIRTVSRSKVWRLMRDALALERERLNQRPIDPAAPNLVYELGQKEGALREVNRLLREGPLLAVYYDRYVRQEREKGESPVTASPPPGEPPAMGDV